MWKTRLSFNGTGKPEVNMKIRGGFPVFITDFVVFVGRK